MVSYLGSDGQTLPTASAWLLKEYACVAKRTDLVERYNQVAGPPSMAVARVQNEFINDAMERQEIVAFVGVCEALIAASKKNKALHLVR
jgi:hypothetical protein